MKSIKKGCAVVLSLAMSVQFGLADSYYLNALADEVSPEQEEVNAVSDNEDTQQTPSTDTEESSNEDSQQVEDTQASEEESIQSEESTVSAPVSNQSEEITKDYSSDIVFNQSTDVTYNVDETVATVTMRVDTTDAVSLDFVNANEAIVNNADVSIDNSKTTSDQKTWVLNITKNGTYTFNAIVVDNESLETVGSKDITVSVTGIKEKKEEVSDSKTKKEAEVKTADETPTTEETLDNFYVTTSKKVIALGDNSVEVKAHFEPSTITNKNVTWSSSNEEVATVDKDGKITTVGVGNTIITATPEINPNMTATIGISVESVKVTKIEISGYSANYLTTGDTVSLTATATPDDAADKTITWTSSNPKVATVDENGLVEAVGQGTVNIVATNPITGVYATQAITVYKTTPATYSVNVWVTNQNKNKTYTFNIPKDGTEVQVGTIAQDTTKDSESFVTTASLRVIPTSVMNLGRGQLPSWSTIQNYAVVKAFKYDEKTLKYTTDGSTWKSVGTSEAIYDFSDIKYTSTKQDNTDVKVTIGDWPYGSDESTWNENQTIQIKIINDEDSTEVYNSGTMRFDNNSNGTYGKIKFNCNQSLYDVSYVVVTDTETKKSTTYKKGSIPSELSVTFERGKKHKYTVVAHIVAKDIKLVYKNGAVTGQTVTGVPSSSTIKTTAKNIGVGSAPSSEGWIFTGWALVDGSSTTIYQPGEEISEVPSSAITAGQLTLEAHWVKASSIITYRVNDDNAGYVTKTYERFNEGQEKTNGSLAVAKDGYEFVNWTNAAGQVVSTNANFQPEVGAGEYTANFVEKITDANVNEPTNYVYDGNAHKWSPTVMDKESQTLTEGKDYTVTYSKDDFTNVTGTITVTITGKGDYTGTVTRTYEINKRTVKLKSESATKVYDGEELRKPTVEFLDDTSFVDGEIQKNNDGSLRVTAVGHIKNVKIENGQVVGVKNTIQYTPTDKFLDSNYDIQYTIGTLTINPVTDKVTVTIKGNIAEGTYSGQEQTVSGYTVESIKIGDKDTDKYTISDFKYNKEGTPSVSGTDAATYMMGLSASDFENTSNNFTNVEFSVTDGKVIISPKKLTVETYSAERVYDGNYLMAGGSVTGFVDGETYGFVTTGKQKDVGESINGYTISYADQSVGNTYTAKIQNYVVDQTTLKIGKLKVTGKTVTVKAENKTKEYGAQDPQLTAQIDGTIGKDTVNYSLSRDHGEAAGHSYTIRVTADQVQGNYIVSTENATLTISKSDSMIITPELTGDSATKVYDGTSLTGGATASITEGTTISYSTDGEKTWSTDKPSITDVGTLNVVAKAENANYETKKVSYTLTVTPATLTVTTNSGSKVYDGQPLTRIGTVSGNGQEKVTFTATGSQTDVGESTNTYTLLFAGEEGASADTNAKRSNYTIEEKLGKLKVTNQSINPDDKESYNGVQVGTLSDVVYNGSEQKQAPTVQTKEGTDLVEGTDYTVSYSKDVKNVGTVTVTVEGKGNYTGTVTRTYKITPASVTVKAKDASKVYGESDPKLTADVSGLIGEDEVSYTVERKTGENVGTYEIIASGKPTQGNYKVEYAPATFTIKSQSIDPSDDTYTGINVSDPSDVVYNGKIQAWKPVVTDKSGNAIVEDMRNGWSMNYVDSDQINVGTITVQILGNGNYTGMLTKTYKITPATVVVTTESATKTYDGSALSASASLSGIVEGETYELHATGSQTEVGSSTNTYSLAWNGTAKESNYTITEKLGTLTVSQATTPVTPSDNTTPTIPVTPSRRVIPNNNVTPVTPVTPSQEETVDEDTTPKAKEKETEKVEKEKTPKAKAKAYWALINLLAAILTVLFGLVLLLSKRHKDDENEEDSEDAETNDENESEEAKKRGMISRVLAVLLGIGSVVFFLLTEDMSNLMTWTDKYTVWMVVLTVVQIVVFCVGRKWKDDSEEDEEENA